MPKYFIPRKRGGASAQNSPALAGELAAIQAAIPNNLGQLNAVASPAFPSDADLANLRLPAAINGAPYISAIPARFQRVGDGIAWDYLCACERSVPGSTAYITKGMASALAAFYRTVEQQGRQQPSIGGRNGAKATLALTVWPSFTVGSSNLLHLNKINLLNPLGAEGVFKTAGNVADDSVFVCPGGEIYKSGAGGNAGGIDFSLTADQVFGHEHTEIYPGLNGVAAPTLTASRTYIIKANAGGADFVPSGAANNNIGTTFVANSTVPTWGTGGRLEEFYAEFAMAAYSRLANAGGGDDNFVGGRNDILTGSARWFFTANASNIRSSAGLTSGAFEFAHGSTAKGLSFFGASLALGYLGMKVTRRTQSVTLQSLSPLAEANGATNRAVPLWLFTYFLNGAGGSIHDRPASLIYAGRADLGVAHADGIAWARALEAVAAISGQEMANQFNPTWRAVQ